MKPLFNHILFLIYQFIKHFKPCLFILKVLKDILQHFKFVNWWIRGFVFLMSRTGRMFSNTEKWFVQVSKQVLNKLHTVKWWHCHNCSIPTIYIVHEMRRCTQAVKLHRTIVTLSLGTKMGNLFYFRKSSFCKII